jgi:hypothetical protein
MRKPVELPSSHHQPIKQKPFEEGSTKKGLRTLLLRLMASVLIIYVLFRIVDWEMTLEQIRMADWRYLAAALMVTLLAIVLSGYKWFLLCRLSGITLKQCLGWYYIGFFFNNILPGSIGGDVVRAYYAGRVMGTASAIASITVERLFAGFALITAALAGLTWLSTDQITAFLIFVIFFIVLSLILFSATFNRMVIKLFGQRAKSFYDAIDQYKQKKRLLVYLFICSFLFQLCYVWITDLIFLSMGQDIPFIIQLGIVSIISALTMLPVTFNGLGLREGAFAYFFAFIGVSQPVAVATSLLFLVIVLVATLPGGLLWWLEKPKLASDPSQSH